MSSLSFFIGTGQLIYCSKSETFAIAATSGRGNCLNEIKCSHLSNTGPIPVGRYFMLSHELSDPNLIHDLGRNHKGDWGDWRIPLHPYPEVNLQGRNNFFIHGGTVLGSAGCIDVGGGILGDKQTDRLKKAILSSDRSELLVIP